MNKLSVFFLIVLAFCLTTSATVAQDMAKLSPDLVKVLLENDHVRVLEVTVKAGGKIPMHSHPGHVVYSLANTKLKTTMADGKVMEAEMKAGDAQWRDALTHANEAVEDVHVLLVEVKDHSAMKHEMKMEDMKKDEMKKKQ